MSCPVCQKNHHALCHKCPHAEDVQAGKYQDKQWDAVPCSGCRLAEQAPAAPSHQGQTFVEFSATEFDQPIDTSNNEDDGGLDIPQKLIEFFYAWLRLPHQQRDAVAWRITNPVAKLREAAKERGVSEQAAFQALKVGMAKIMAATGATGLRPYRKKNNKPLSVEGPQA